MRPGENQGGLAAGDNDVGPERALGLKLGRNLWACGCCSPWLMWAPATAVCVDHKVLVL